MSNSHTIRCSYGKLRGLLRTTTLSNRCVCYCTDCQAFARHLGAKSALDKQGGMEIIQVPAPNVTFIQGSENLACLRLTGTGMLRWYSTCCGTPIGNTPANWRIAFVGLIHTCLIGEDQSLEAAFGPVTMRGNVKGATGEKAPAASGLFSGVAKILAMIAKARVSGSYRISPFFNPQTGASIATPTVLSLSELTAAKRTA
jgi:hypothetical protein